MNTGPGSGSRVVKAGSCALLLCLLVTQLGRALPKVGADVGTLINGDIIIDYNNAFPDANLPPGSPLQSESLKNSQPLSSGLDSGVYVNSVGGIAFDKTGRPFGELESLELTYDPRQDDGQRLIVRWNKRSYRVSDLPDWQLDPIARFADSPYFAAVTLHGKLVGDAPKPPDVEHVVGLHPELEQTLLGLRLLQADLMLLDPNSTGELPRYTDSGDFLLGTGEHLPARNAWFPSSIAINNLIKQHSDRGENFQSYVVCDVNTQPQFGIKDGRFVTTGDPYFYFWHKGGPKTERVVEPGKPPVLYQSFQVIHLKELSDELSSRTDLLSTVNQPVYSALVNTLRFAAFFRYCKRKDLPMWQKFIQSLDDADPDLYWAPKPVTVRSHR